jgi:hypothetical protein
MKLESLLDAARHYVMSPEEKEAQRRSFAFGNGHISNEHITRAAINAAADAMPTTRAATEPCGNCAGAGCSLCATMVDRASALGPILRGLVIVVMLIVMAALFGCAGYTPITGWSACAGPSLLLQVCVNGEHTPDESAFEAEAADETTEPAPVPDPPKPAARPKKPASAGPIRFKPAP